MAETDYLQYIIIKIPEKREAQLPHVPTDFFNVFKRRQ